MRSFFLFLFSTVLCVNISAQTNAIITDSMLVIPSTASKLSPILLSKKAVNGISHLGSDIGIIESYSIAYGSNGQYVSKQIRKSIFAGEVRRAVANLKVGANVYFDNVRVKKKSDNSITLQKLVIVIEE